MITFRRQLMPLGADDLPSVCDYLVWYAKDKAQVKYRQLFSDRRP